MTGPPLALVGAVARLLNSGLGSEAALAAVVERIRVGLPAESVTLWVRRPGSTALGGVSSPPSPGGPLTAVGPERLPEVHGGRRFTLEHEGTRVGLLDVRAAIGTRELELLAVVTDVLAPFLASQELSEDLAVEVAAQSREIEEHRRFTSLVIDSLPVGLYVVDRDYRIQIWNRKRETGTQGLRRDDVVGRPVFEVLTRQSADELRQEFDRVFRTGEIRQSEQEVVLGGETRWFRLSKIPMRLGGDEISHVITIGEDVTDWRRIQARISQSEKLAAIGQLAAGVMHEINNPLATISACVAAIGGRLRGAGSAAAGVDEYLEIIDKEVDRCSRIVDGLLDFSRPKETSKAAVDLNALVEETLFLLKHHRQFKRLTVVRELAPAGPRTIGNAEQLIQVLMALMLNAFDAMERGGVLTVRTRGGDGGGEEALVEVQDTGIGIPESEQGKIFEPFYTTKPPGRGTGLGLSICYGIVQDHRGRLEVESTPGTGSVFRVWLPGLDYGSGAEGRGTGA
ncbi:MAG TPA: ATP-binding protein [Gemmatimonadales bacterium]|nr:ATP-binding protein [Gemmatimonadales bacterium]